VPRDQALPGLRADPASFRLLPQWRPALGLLQTLPAGRLPSGLQRRRQDPATVEQIRDRDRRRKRTERARTAEVDPDKELRNGRVRTAAIRRLIHQYQPEYRALLREERARLGGGADATR
jgi:hypothetical protein